MAFKPGCSECGSFAINHQCHGRDGSDGHLCDVCYWRKRAEVKQANAALIAAAPELLAALEGLLADLQLRAQIEGDIDADGCAVLNCGNGVLYTANKAIEKAKGGAA